MSAAIVPAATHATALAAGVPPHAADCLVAHVLTPPGLRWVGGEPLAARLLHTARDAALALPGIRAVVVRNNFAGVAAVSAAQAADAARALRARWSAPPRADATPAARHTLAQRGHAAEALARAGARDTQHYQWPLAGTGDEACCTAVADWRDGTLTLWLPATRPGALRTELAALLGIAPTQVQMVCWQARDDRGDPALLAPHAAADAALLAHASGQPVVRRLCAAEAGLADAALDVRVDSARSGATVDAYAATLAGTPPPAAPLALWLTRTAVPVTDSIDAGNTAGAALPPYGIPHVELALCGDPAAFAAAPLTAARAQLFARESHLDELAAASGADPVALRLAHLHDPRGAALVRQVAERAGWDLDSTAAAPRANSAAGNVRRGRGFAYAHTIDHDAGRSWSAWVAEVEVDRSTGELAVTRVTVGHDSESLAPLQATAATRSIEQDVAAAALRLTAATPGFDTWPAATHGAGDTLPAVPAQALPEVRLAGTLATHDALAAGATDSLPAAAAVANAIYNATGVRLRKPPFSAERIRLALAEASPRDKRKQRGWIAAAAAAAAGVCATLLPWRAPIAPVAPPEPGFYSAATLERGRLVAAAGDCAVCHTAPGGAKNAGGLPLETPFGTVYSTNITPDVQTGIGNWSFAAFERAMREGIHRDGRRLYPAFPYTAFAKISDGDMQALYGYLMSAEPVTSAVPPTQLAFPFNLRPLLAGWNLLFHRNERFAPDPSRSAQWNRGAYLAEGLGHCSACHSPRNPLGAEQGGRRYLTGGSAEGWEAPALTALSQAPVPWTEAALFTYLRGGYAPHHGAAAGPMAPVVEELAQLPEDDVRAIAHYVASFGAPAPAPSILAAQAAQFEQRSQQAARTLGGPAERLYQSACAVCHQSDQGIAQFGVKPSLALNTNLHSKLPDNVIQVLLRGMPAPPNSELGAMPAYADTLDDRQIAQLAQYLRARFAPDKPAWQDLEKTVARLRATPAH
ncbi:putative Cytochrome c, alcohol dehydrogenase-like subunit [Cupriavidus taiwanensis]|uniref:c-type cytochrome n=1 Tax=Cupriavidus taiwanensis TaxID=164546 RepID=UPI000E127C7C|nr:cytochrome c [Cupriavidus taiwanensis]SPA30691.1 putative Cytochrome c, alcohol dehydrogenase-like subunit [Cupriavidus taiwanensis]